MAGHLGVGGRPTFFPEAKVVEIAYINSNHRGSAVDNAGQKVINISPMSIAKKNGIIGGTTRAILVLPTLQLTNKHAPTGGVHSPIQRFAIKTMPN